MAEISFLESIAIEKKRRKDGRNFPDPNATLLWEKAVRLIKDHSKVDELNRAYSFAKKIDYKHDGLTSEIYFAHPVRTAAMALLCKECTNIDSGIIGLLHNVFELSEVDPAYFGQLFGIHVSDQISTLTVNRILQWDADYKKSYYERINNSELSCRIVKVFDKLDNLFLLELNPDASVKRKYIEEVKTYILPMCERDLPSIFNYLKDLVIHADSLIMD